MIFYEMKRSVIFNFLKNNSYKISHDLIKSIFDFMAEKISGELVFNDRIKKKITFILDSVKRRYKKFQKRTKKQFYSELERTVQFPLEVVPKAISCSESGLSKIIEKLNCLLEEIESKIKILEKVRNIILYFIFK
jgi:hypothetical protein